MRRIQIFRADVLDSREYSLSVQYSSEAFSSPCSFVLQIADLTGPGGGYLIMWRIFQISFASICRFCLLLGTQACVCGPFTGA